MSLIYVTEEGVINIPSFAEWALNLSDSDPEKFDEVVMSKFKGTKKDDLFRLLQQRLEREKAEAEEAYLTTFPSKKSRTQEEISAISEYIQKNPRAMVDSMNDLLIEYGINPSNFNIQLINRIDARMQEGED